MSDTFPSTPALRHFNEHGYCVVRNLVPLQVLSDVISSINKTIKDQIACIYPGKEEESLFSNLQTLHALDIVRYKKTLAALWRKETVFRLMHCTEITGFLREHFGFADLFMPGGQVVHIMSDRLRIPGGYFGLVPHQDFPSVQGSLNGVVVWLPLVDVDTSNYPLEVLPGSHRLGLAPTIEHGSSTREVPKDWMAGLEFKALEMKAGDVVFLSMFTIHRSSVTGREQSFRISVSTRFDDADETTFVDRAYPTAYARTVHRDLYVPDFPSLDLVKEVFK
jgi:ectoine hydroxylase-related dioxygenase (phytanoyl-CoA dioxygenase family)